jgi:hypothetical protein
MVVIVIGLTAVPLAYELPTDTAIWNEIQNTGHTPLFGIVALLMLAISVRLLRGRIHQRLTHYAIALIVTCLMGAITEYAQIDGPRDADLADILRDLAGAVSFLGLYMYFDVHLTKSWPRATGRLRKTVLMLSIIVVAASLVPLTLTSTAYLQRNSAFPTICDFDSYWVKRFLTTESARLKIVSPPTAMQTASVGVGQLNLRAGDYPGFGIFEPYPDWREYQELVLDIYSPLDSTISIRIRVEDSYHDGNLTDRFNRTLTLTPGESRIVIPLKEIRSGPAKREMDMSDIAAIHFFAVDLKQRITLYFDTMRLQ